MTKWIITNQSSDWTGFILLSLHNRMEFMQLLAQ